MNSEDNEKSDILKSMTGIDRSIEESKEILKFTKIEDKGSEPDIQDLDQEKQMIIDFIPNLSIEFKNEIPFQAFKDATLLDFTTIKDALLELIMEKKITGFINDSSTADDLSDDILILRDQRFVDRMEPSYRVG